MLTIRLLKNISNLCNKETNLIGTQYFFKSRHKPLQLFCKRSIQKTTNYGVKIFTDRENGFAHDVLEQSLRPYQIFRLDNTIYTDNDAQLTDVIACSTFEATELFSHFRKLMRHCAATRTSISHDKFNDFIQIFIDNCQKLNDEQLLETLQLIKQLPAEETVRTENFMKLWNRLDVVCCSRIEKWNTKQLLLVCDAWYSLNLARICKFVWEAIRKMSRKISSMPPEQLVQTMFLCNVIRRPVYDMIEIEVNLIKCIETLSLQELGIMSMGFFKTKTQIHNAELINTLYRRLLAELDTVEDITLSAILKILRYSSKLNHVQPLEELMESLRSHVERISLLSCLHVALLGTDIQCCNDALIEQVLQRFSKNIEQTRLKDLERICLVMGMFNFRSKNDIEKELSEKIVQQLHIKVDEIMRHPRCFPICLQYLSIMGIYDNDLLSAALDPRFIRHAYGRNLMLGREIFQLDSFIKINLKDNNYDGHQLSEKNRKSMGKLLTHYIPERSPKFKLSATDQILVEVRDTVVLVVKEAIFKHVLPHFERPDIVVIYDKINRKAIPISKDCPDDYTGVILTRKELLGDLDSSDYDVLIITIAGWNNMVRGKQRFTGLFDLKLKQLQLLGLKHFVINWYDWRELETPIDRRDFIKRKINAILNI